jgi:hypothetical protein
MRLVGRIAIEATAQPYAIDGINSATVSDIGR